MKKRNTTIACTLMLFMSIFLIPADVGAQIKWQEDFNYPAGNLYGHGGWGKYGSNPNEPIQVVEQTLDYKGYPGGVKGKSVKLGAASSGEDLLVRFDPSEEGIKTGTMYYSALINVSEAPSGPVYVMALLARTFSSVVKDGTSPTELGRLYIDVGDDEGHYKLGVERGSTKAVYANRSFNIGETYLVVVKYEIGAAGERYDGVTLYVNPASYTEEPKVADAVFDPSSAGSGISKWGLQGLELRQGTNYSATAPTLLVGSLRVADNYAELFTESAGPGEDTPVITLSERGLDFGTLYSGDTKTKTVNVKGVNLTGDITITVDNDELKPSVTTISAAEAMNIEGVDVDFTLTPTSETGKATITFASEGSTETTLSASWSTIAVKDIATLKEFAAEDGEAYLTYRYKGKAIVTFVDKSQSSPVYYLQDETGGLQVKNDYEMMTETYKEGDMVTEFIGMITSSFGVNSFIPLTTELGTLISENNNVEPVTVTLAELKASTSDYTNRLVRVADAQIKDVAENTTFTEGMTQPTITDATGEGKLRLFKGTTLIGKTIPTETVHITGLSTSSSAVLVAPRKAEDIKTATAPEPALTIIPAKFDMAAGIVGKSTEVGTIHISALNMPAATNLEIIGKNRDMFELSATSISAGTNETDIVITYNPTAIGKHEGRLFIDCPEMPLLSQSITLSAYAIDEQNPPTVTISPETLPTFEAKAGETQEKNISITTAHLPDYAYMKLKESGTFRISTTMLMKDATASVKLTFAPTAAGEYNNEIEIYGLGLDTLRVKINGKASESIEPEPEKEGDELPLDASSPMKLVNEHFDNITKNKPLSIEGWRNLAMVGKRAWWGYELPEEDGSTGEKVAKVTAYDSSVAEGKETACEMMLVTPALDFKNSESKIFTFRVRGDYLLDNQTDLLELCYIDLAEGDMFIAPVDGFSMPNMQDQSGEWQEFHIDLTGQNIADVFFMGFRFKSTRGRTNSVTYYIDDVSYGRTDLAVIRPSHKQLVFNATAGIDAISDEVTVTGNNLTEPIKLTLSGPNKSKFKLSTNQLPVTGGSFMVSFNSDEIGVHEAYVKLASRGAADIYVPISVNNTVAGSIEGISTEHSNIEVYDLNGRKVAEQKMTTAKKATKNLPAGIYVIKLTSDKGINFYKIKIK